MDIELTELILKAKEEYIEALREIRKAEHPTEAQWQVYDAAAKKLAQLENEWKALMHPWGSD
jgi:hypothetical protein